MECNTPKPHTNSKCEDIPESLELARRAMKTEAWIQNIMRIYNISRFEAEKYYEKIFKSK